MAERVERPDSEDIEEKQQRQRAELRADLEKKLSDESLRKFDLMDELWDSGEMQEMVESRDFSDLPAELRPEAKQYRRRSGSDTWHWCSNCSNYPSSGYETSGSKPSSGELCNQCQSKEAEGDCR